jgi:hypothetical protein
MFFTSDVIATIGVAVNSAVNSAFAGYLTERRITTLQIQEYWGDESYSVSYMDGMSKDAFYAAVNEALPEMKGNTPIRIYIVYSKDGAAIRDKITSDDELHEAIRIYRLKSGEPAFRVKTDDSDSPGASPFGLKKKRFIMQEKQSSKSSRSENFPIATRCAYKPMCMLCEKKEVEADRMNYELECHHFVDHALGKKSTIQELLTLYGIDSIDSIRNSGLLCKICHQFFTERRLAINPDDNKLVVSEFLVAKDSIWGDRQGLAMDRHHVLTPDHWLTPKVMQYTLTKYNTQLLEDRETHASNQDIWANRAQRREGKKKGGKK